jgi:hypothetical protein
MHVYKENPSLIEVIKSGKFEVKPDKTREVVDDKGNIKYETIKEGRVCDIRSYVKIFSFGIDKMVRDFEGNPKCQIIFLLMSALENRVRQDEVNLGYTHFSKLCKKHDVKLWSRPQLSNCIKWLLEKEYLFKPERSLPGVYFVNIKFIYNGSLARQLGYDNVHLGKEE